MQFWLSWLVGIVITGVLLVLSTSDSEATEPQAEDRPWRSDQEPALPEWLTDYTLHVPIIGIPPSPPNYDPYPGELSESEALMESLTPAVRASYKGVLREREDAQKREHEREEAEYAAFVEGRLRRLRGERASGK